MASFKEQRQKERQSSFRELLLQVVEEEEPLHPVRALVCKQLGKELKVGTLSLMLELLRVESGPAIRVMLAKVLELAIDKYKSGRAVKRTLYLTQQKEKDRVVKLAVDLILDGDEWWSSKSDNVSLTLCDSFEYFFNPRVGVYDKVSFLKGAAKLLLAKTEMETGETHPKKLVPILIAGLAEEATKRGGYAFYEASPTPVPAVALGALGSVAEKAIPTLEKALNFALESPWHERGYVEEYDATRCLRAAAAWTLGMIGSEEAVPPLIKALSRDPHPVVASMAAWALGEIGSEEAVVTLRKARYELIGYWRDEWATLQVKTATAALQRLGEELDDVSLLIDTLRKNEYDFEEIQGCFAEMGEKAVPELIPILQEDRDPKMRKAAALALTIIAERSEREFPLLDEALEKDPSLRKEVEEFIEEWDWILVKSLQQKEKKE